MPVSLLKPPQVVSRPTRPDRNEPSAQQLTLTIR
jgi:hypothetical protein